jgi:hypothetical protein
MKSIRTIVILGFAAAAVTVADMESLRFDFGLTSDAEAVAGHHRRTRRRGLAVGYAAGSGQAEEAEQAAHAAQQDAAAAEQQAAAAEQQAALAQQEAEFYKQQAMASQQQAAAPAAAAPAPAPTTMVASLPQGCVSAGSVFQCGNTYYKPYMVGDQIVYGVVPGP